MSNQAKQTLSEAKVAALRAELNEAEDKIRTIEIDRKTIVEKDRLIAALTAKTKQLTAEINRLAGNQLTDEQERKVQNYDRLSNALDERNRQVTKLNENLFAAANKLEKVEKSNRQSEESISSLESSLNHAKRKNKKYGYATGAAVSLLILTAFGSYYYVDSELAPPANISHEAGEAFIKHAPEFRSIIAAATDQEREKLKSRSEELRVKIRSYDDGQLETWFSRWATYFLICIVTFVFTVICTVVVFLRNVV